MKFLSPEVTLYLNKYTIWPCMEHCFYVLAGAPSCYLIMLDRLQRQICRTVHPSLAALLKPFAHSWNVASLSLFCRYYFGRCSSELAQLVPLPYSWERSTYYHDRLHHFYHHMSFVTEIKFHLYINLQQFVASEKNYKDGKI